MVRTGTEGEDDGFPDSSLRRRAKVRPEKGSEAGADEAASRSISNNGSAEDRRTRLSRTTKEIVYKDPPWGTSSQKKASSHPTTTRKRGTGGQQSSRGRKTQANQDQEDPMDVDEAQAHTSAAKRKRAESAAGPVEPERQQAAQTSQKEKKRSRGSGEKAASDGKVSAQAQPANTAHRTYPAAKINENAPSSDEEPESPRALPPKLARKVHLTSREGEQSQSLNDDGEDAQEELAGSEGSGGEEVEPRDGDDALIDVNMEAVTTFANHKTTGDSEPAEHDESGDEEGARAPARRGHRAPGASDRRARSVPSDDEDIFSGGEVNSEDPGRKVHKSARKQRGPSRREQKLKEELPMLSAPKKMTSKAKSKRRDVEDDGEDLPWFAHTDITDALVATSKTSWTISLTLLNPSMAEVVREALRLGAIALEIGAPNMTLETMHEFLPYTPFQPKGLNQYGIDALISAAERLGYGSRNDIAHRLEAGSTTTYIHPPASYVGGRLRSYRGSIKTAAIQVVPGALRLPDGPDNTRDRTGDELRSLATDVNFLFPMNSRTGDFDDSKPFSGAGIKEIIKAAFFVDKQWYNVGLSNLRLFRATENFPADEPEVTPVMLALAATALEATLRDMTNSGEQDFAGNLYHDSFKDHLETALDFRQKKPSNYHKLTHDLLVYASNGRVRPGASANAGSGRRPRRARINWDAIQEPDA